jgi:hypothetical protein
MEKARAKAFLQLHDVFAYGRPGAANALRGPGEAARFDHECENTNLLEFVHDAIVNQK